LEWRFAGETEILGENLPQRHFVHHKSHLPDPGWNPGRRGGKPATNRLSYRAASMLCDSEVDEQFIWALLFITASKPALGPNQWVPGAFSPTVRRLEREAGPPSI
jgi:hypothetical protein